MTNESKTRPSTVFINDVDHPDEPKQGKPVDVNSEITPITRQEIKQVDATTWSELSVAQLHDQLNILENRLAFAQRIGHIDMMTQIRRGIGELRSLIHEKTPRTFI